MDVSDYSDVQSVRTLMSTSTPRYLQEAVIFPGPSRAILDITRTFSRDDSRFQNIPNIFYGQDPFRSIVKSFHEIYCKAASHTMREGENWLAGSD